MERVERIDVVKVVGPMTVNVQWREGSKDDVDLAGWVDTGGALLVPLANPETFKDVRVVEHGAALEWAGDEDLAIDAHHLSLIARVQRAPGKTELADWQAANHFTDLDVATTFGVGRSTWANYKANADRVPRMVLMYVRAVQIDPVLLHAIFKRKRGKSGRPSTQKVLKAP